MNAGQVPMIGLLRRVGPPGGELEGVRGLLLAALGRPRTPRCAAAAGGVGVVLRERAVGDHEELDVLEQPGVGPEAVALVAVDLVERLADVDAPRRLSSTCTSGRPLTRIVTS